MPHPPDPLVGQFSGAVLCGGESRRMGRDKALLEVGGVAMARRVADALTAAGATKVVAIGGDDAGLAALGLATRADDHPGAGPLAATITALGASTASIVMILACDLLESAPSAIEHTVHALRREPDALVAVPVVDAIRQWGHAAWRPAAHAVLVEAWRDGARSPRRAAEQLTVAEVQCIDPRWLADADNPADLP